VAVVSHPRPTFTLQVNKSSCTTRKRYVLRDNREEKGLRQRYAQILGDPFCMCNPNIIQARHFILSRDTLTIRLKHYSEMLNLTCRAQWSRGLRHEPSSPARILGSWVRISLEAWMFVYVYSVLCCSVYR
jgi:hypothetical protein